MIGTTMNLTEISFHRFICAQVKYINDAKYFEGINTQHDPGDIFVETFVIEKGLYFRNSWNNSQCSACSKDCGDLLKKQCDMFKPLEDINEPEQSYWNT